MSRCGSASELDVGSITMSGEFGTALMDPDDTLADDATRPDRRDHARDDHG